MNSQKKLLNKVKSEKIGISVDTNKMSNKDAKIVLDFLEGLDGK